MKIRTAALLFILGSLAAPAGIRHGLDFTPLHPVANEPVDFTLTPSAANLDPDRGIAWSFGDGSTATTQSTQLSQAHTYASPGTYSVSASYYYRTVTGTSSPASEFTFVTVGASPSRSILVQPLSANTCENISFQARDFGPGMARWDFGDGTIVPNGSANQVHAYLQPGTYFVRAEDGGAGAAPVTVTVTVLNKRSLSAAPAAAKTGQVVNFRAQDFLTPCVKWDFGDGTISGTGLASAAHVYSSAGTFQVKATEDCGSSACSAAISISVSPIKVVR
jgi:PKD repeat protein